MGETKPIAVETCSLNPNCRRDAVTGKQGIFISLRSLLGRCQLHLEMAKLICWNNKCNNSLAIFPSVKGKTVQYKCFSVVIIHLLIRFLIQMTRESQRSLEFNIAKTLPILEALFHETFPAMICLFLLCSPVVTGITPWNRIVKPLLA